MENRKSERDTLSSSLCDQNVADYSSLLTKEGIRSTKFNKPNVMGDVRNVKRFTWVEWIFLAIGVLAFIGTLAITVERLVYFQSSFNASDNTTNEEDCDTWTCISDFTFTITLMANISFCLFYGVDGILRERGFEMLAVPVAVIVVLIYIIVNISTVSISQLPPDQAIIRIVRLIVALLIGIPLAIFAVLIYIRMGRLQFVLVGGNNILIHAYRLRSIVLTIITFNIHALVNIVILASVRNLELLNEYEKIILPILFVYIIAFSFVGWMGIYYELYSMTIMFLIFLFPTSAYYIYKIYNVVHMLHEYHNTYLPVTLIVVNIISLIILVFIYIFTLWTMKYFKKGLNEKVNLPLYWCYKKLIKKQDISLQ